MGSFQGEVIEVLSSMGKVSTSQMAIVSDSRRLSSPIPITAISMEDKTNEIIITGPRSNLFSNRKILDSRDYRSLADPKRVIFGNSNLTLTIVLNTMILFAVGKVSPGGQTSIMIYTTDM